MIRRCVLAAALAWGQAMSAQALGTLHLASAAPASGKEQAAMLEAASALKGRGDAESLAAAAALSFAASAGGMKSEAVAARSSALDWAAEASELAPDNPGIGWLHLELCANTAGCDIRDAATTLRWIDADNSAAWLPSLAAAQKQKDATEVDRVLADMAQGLRFDLYWNRTVVLLFDALKRAASPLPAARQAPDGARLREAVAVAGALIVPSFAPLAGACREAAGTERREACLRISKIMQRGDTLIAQMAGFGIERRLAAADGKEARALAERRRILEWRAASASQFDDPLLPWLKNARARSLIKAMRATPREEDVDVAILREHKMPLEPPEEHR